MSTALKIPELKQESTPIEYTVLPDNTLLMDGAKVVNKSGWLEGDIWDVHFAAIKLSDEYHAARDDEGKGIFIVRYVSGLHEIELPITAVTRGYNVHCFDGELEVDIVTLETKWDGHDLVIKYEWDPTN